MANDDKTILTQDSYRNRPGAQRWSQEETTEFYAVSQAVCRRALALTGALWELPKPGSPALIARGGDLRLLLRGQLQSRPALPMAVPMWGAWPASWGPGRHAACQVVRAGVPALLLKPHGLTALGQMFWRLAAKSLGRPQVSMLPWWHPTRKAPVASQAVGMAWQLTLACVPVLCPSWTCLSQADSMQQECMPVRQATLPAALSLQLPSSHSMPEISA